MSATSDRGAVLSLIVPVLEAGSPQSIRDSVESVLAQTDARWQLICLLGPASGDAAASALIASTRDSRVVTRETVENDFAAVVNEAIAEAGGEYSAILHPGDVLDDDAVERFADAVASSPKPDVVYTDEYLVDARGERVGELRKPDFSPERLRNQPYLGRLCAIDTAWAKAEGLRQGFGAATEYDLVLRATEGDRTVANIREPLYGRRVAHKDEPALLVGEDSAAAVRAVEEHLSRTGIEGSAEWLSESGTIRVRRRIIGEPLVSIVIPTRGSRAVIRGQESCLVVDAITGVLEKSSYRNVEFVVVADDATPPDVIEDLKAVAGDRLRLVPWSLPFNFSAKVNKGAIFARGEYLLLLNDDIEVTSPDWIEAMLGLAQQDGVGAVGAMLYFEDDTIQHGGHLYSGGGAGHIGFGWANEIGGLPGSMAVDREVSGATAACLLLPRRVFFEIGGFTRRLPSNFNDVDFCMKVTGAGHKILWTPHAKLYHFESKSRVTTVVEYEVTTLYARWSHRMAFDPYWPQ